MKIKPTQLTGARNYGTWGALLGATLLLTLAVAAQAAGKGGGGTTTKDVNINCKLTLDRNHPASVVGALNGVIDDGKGPYVHGVDFVTAHIGAEHSMTVFTSQFKKEPIRHFYIQRPPNSVTTDPFPFWAKPPCDPSAVAGDGSKPVFATDIIFRSMFQVFGANFDNMTIGEVRENLKARLVITANGQTWTVYFGPSQHFTGSAQPCASSMTVIRESATVWTFKTIEKADGQHGGYLYYYVSSPAGEVFAGYVHLPFSGKFEALTSAP